MLPQVLGYAGGLYVARNVLYDEILEVEQLRKGKSLMMTAFFWLSKLLQSGHSNTSLSTA